MFSKNQVMKVCCSHVLGEIYVVTIDIFSSILYEIYIFVEL